LLLFSRTLVFFFVSAPHRLLPSSPTRRSSDLLMEPVMSPAPCPAVAGGPRALLRLEGAALFALATFLFWKTGTSWWLYAVLILAPDLSMLGYLAGHRIGSGVYNAFHTIVGPAILGAAGFLLPSFDIIAIALIWIAHIGADR